MSGEISVFWHLRVREKTRELEGRTGRSEEVAAAKFEDQVGY